MLTAAATMAVTWASSDTSTVTAVAVPPAPTISATADSAWSAATSATTTWAPSAAKSEAATRPIPLPAPVITATLPSSRAIAVSSRTDAALGAVVGVVRAPDAGAAPGCAPYRRAVTAVGYCSPCRPSPSRPPVPDRSSGSPRTDRPPRGGRGSATRPWCPAPTSTWSRRRGARRCSSPPGGGGRTGRRRPLRPGGRRPRRPGRSSAAGTSTPPATVPIPTRATAAPAAERDELELGLLGAALERDLPVLAICRGMQALNVHLGGELVQQLPDLLGTTVHQPRPGAFGPVTVVTEEGSAVAQPVGGPGRGPVQPPPGPRPAGCGPGGHGPERGRGDRGRRAARAAGSWSASSGIPRRPATSDCSMPWSGRPPPAPRETATEERV